MSWTFGVDADQLWRTITCTDEYRSWWPWLRAFEAGDGLRVGAAWECRVRPPFGYSVRFVVHVDAVVPEEHISARVTGDIVGRADLFFSSGDAGVTTRLVSELTAARTLLRVGARIARPVVEWGHRRVIADGGRQFAGHTAIPIVTGASD